jgi:spoIIIJ-associated protein
MEWVETTGRTIEEAKDTALDQLGVDEQDAEFEIVGEPKFGLFGRLRAEARVRARVRPATPRPKDDRRDRRRRRKEPGAGESTSVAAGPTTADDSSSPAGQLETAIDERPSDAGEATSSPASNGPRGSDSRRRTHRGSRRRSSPNPTAPGIERGDDEDVQQRPRTARDARDGGTGMTVSLEEQGEVAREFLDGLVDEMDLDAEIAIGYPDEETVELNVRGEDLGLLIGAKGATLLALQDLTRTVVQRRTSAVNGRLTVDVSGYRQKRKEALERFTHQLADEVKATGTRRVLEPMSAADRKIVHDKINELDGVSTTSEGEEPRRRVVILPSQS